MLVDLVEQVKVPKGVLVIMQVGGNVGVILIFQHIFILGQPIIDFLLEFFRFCQGLFFRDEFVDLIVKKVY